MNIYLWEKNLGCRLPITGIWKSPIFVRLISAKLAECTKILFLIMKVPFIRRPYTLQNLKSHRRKICYDFSKMGTFFSFFVDKSCNFWEIFFFVWHPIDTIKIRIFGCYNFLSGEVCGQESQNSILHFLRGHKIEKFISPPRGGLAQKNFWPRIKGRYTFKMSH